MLNSEDKENPIPLDRIYNRYIDYCDAEDITLPPDKQHFGWTISKLFPNVNRRRRKMLGKTYICYEGLKLILSEGSEEETSIVAPEYCSIQDNEKYVRIEYPTEFLCDNQVVNKTFGINKEDGSLLLTVNGCDVNVSKFGLKPRVKLTQMTVNSLTAIASAIKLCQGQSLESGVDSSVIVMKKWNTILDEPSNITFRFHSRRCFGVLMFNATTKTTCCEHCTRDINHVDTYRKAKIEKNVGSTSVSTQCDQFEESDVLKPSVLLCDEDNEDFKNILQSISAKAPQFKLLFESQLSNAQHKDARQRRWDPAVISLCINLWAR